MSELYKEVRMRFPDFKTKAVTFSFDDGAPEDREMVRILNEYGIRGTFNLNGGRLGSSDRISAEEIPELYEGHEVAAHSLTHPNLDELDLGGIAYQIVTDRRILEKAVGRPVQGFAYPNGLRETPGLVDTVRQCGIRYARTTKATHGFLLPEDPLRLDPTCIHYDPAFPELREQFFQPDDPDFPRRVRLKLFYIWGHSYEFRNAWDGLRRVCEAVAGKEEVWYATNGEIIDYMEAYRSLRRTVEGNILYNPTDKDVYIWTKDGEAVVPKGETVKV